MDIHNYPVDLAVKLAEDRDRVRRLLRERSARLERGERESELERADPERKQRGIGRRSAADLRSMLAVGFAAFAVRWLASPRR